VSIAVESVDLKAVTTAATDKGLFECVVSSAAVDREGDVTSTHGMLAALRRWSDAGWKVPLVWHHGVKAEDSIGWIDGSTARIVGNEVVVGGFIDKTTPIGPTPGALRRPAPCRSVSAFWSRRVAPVRALLADATSTPWICSRSQRRPRRSSLRPGSCRPRQ
jgi:hypothetical protein